MLSGLGRRELVLLETAHLAGQIGREHLELQVALGHDLLGDLTAPLVPGLPRLLGQLFEPGALLGHHLVQFLLDLVEGPAQLTALELLLAGLAQALHELAQALDPVAVGSFEARREQPPQGRVGVPVVEQVVGQLGEQLVHGVDQPVLGAVPAPVVPAVRHGPSSVAGPVIRVPGRWPWPRPPPC